MTMEKYHVQAIIDQNAAVHTIAFGPGIEPLVEYGKDPSNPKLRQDLVDFLSPQSIIELYFIGTPEPTMVDPSSYTLANTWLAKPGSIQVELDTFQSFAQKISMYPKWQQWLRRHQPALLAIWGAHDQAQLPAGAEAFKQDLPYAEVILVDAGHFALETAVVEMAFSIVAFLKKAGV